MMMMIFAALLTAQQTFIDAVKNRDADTVRTMLASDPALASLKTEKGISMVTQAMFALKKGEESFQNPATNATLQAILERKPELDLFETAALGTPEQLRAKLRDNPDGVKARARFGWTPLHMASFGGNVPNTQLLISLGADINSRAQSKFRNTPLQTALLSGQYATTKVLIENGADALVRQAHGITPMHEAAQLGRADIIELLLANGAEINSVDDAGRTPLVFAIRGKHDDLVAAMKARGARVELKEEE